MPASLSVPPGNSEASPAGTSSLRVLVCPDKFKGTLTAPKAAESIAAGWHSARPADVVELLPISDGGDGFGELLSHHLRAQEQTCLTVDAAHRPLTARWWWEPERRLAIIESARVIGLAMLPPGRFHPFALDTFGLGAVLLEAAARQPKTLLVGIGGSATNDAAFGLARALGWQFLDALGQPIENWPDLVNLRRVVKPPLPANFPRVRVAVDVQNPLLGARGASRVYGPQKGLRPSDMPAAEAALSRLVQVLTSRWPTARARARAPGSGAAGGLGFGLSLFARGGLEPGFALFARETGFTERLRAADLVVTGEGALDETTVRMGKGVGQVAQLCRRLGIPCLGLGGSVNLGRARAHPFTAVAGIVPELAPLDAARADAARWLRALARRAAAEWRQPLGGRRAIPTRTAG